MRKITILLTFLFLAGMQYAFAQAGTISGKVTSSDDGSGIPGVTIQVKGTTIGTTTDINGDYSLGVEPAYEVLIFSYVGMTTVEVTIGDQTVINVVLTPSAQLMDEVVVTALGISREKKALGYSVQDVDGAALTYGNNADMVNALSSRTAGVQVQSSGGSAGASSFITIRGAASITGNNQPLFVVDGQPIRTEMDWGGSEYQTEGVNSSSRSIDINSEDIETVSVLKGGAATALYGVQAANGVILITTKKGKLAKTAGEKKKLNINFHYAFGIDKLSQRIPLTTKYSQGINGNWQSGYSGTWGANMDTMSYSKDPSVWDTWSDYDVDGSLVGQNDPLANGEQARTYNQYDFFQTGYTHNTNLSVSAANEKSSVYLSVGNLNQEGIIPNNTLNRTSVRLNAESKVTDWLTIGGHANYINTNGNFIQNGSNTSGIMLGLTRTPSSFNNGAGWKFEDGTQRNYRHGGGYDNPYWVSNEIYFHDKVNRLIGDAYFKVNFTKDLNLSYTLGIDYYNRRWTDMFSVGSRGFPAGRLEESAEQNKIINSNLLLNYNKMFNSNFTLNVTLGWNLFESKRDITRALANDLSIPGFDWVQNTTDPNVTSIRTNWRTSAFFGDFRFDLFNQLYLGVTARYESATTMPEDNKSSLYPSFSLGWVFTEIIPENKALTFGKVRASWAKTANIADPYNTATYYNLTAVNDGWTVGIDFPWQGYSGYEVGYLLGNSDLKHETMQTFEIGAELKFLNNRIGIDVGYFNNNNNDLLLEVPVATTSGYNNVYLNAATIESNGWEITFYATPVAVKNFNWDIMVNWTTIKSTVTELATGVDNVFLGGFTDPQVRAVVGMDYGTIFGYDWWRAEDGTMLINNDPNDDYPDGKPWTNDTAQVPLGSVNPDWTMNISNTFSFFGVSIYTLVDIRYGGLMYNGTRFTLNFFGQTEETENRDVVYLPDGSIDYENTPAENIVVYEGYPGHLDADGNPVWTETQNTTQVVNDQAWWRGHGGNFGGGPTAAAIEDASWLRLREITIAYRFPDKLMKKTGFIHGLEIYATGRNLYLNTSYQGIDPETSLTGARNSQGFDYFNNPGTKSYIFGIRASF